MKKISITTLLALFLTIPALAGQGYEWTKISDNATFNHGTDLVDACEFQGDAKVADDVELTLEERAEGMSAVMATPDGQVYEGKIDPEYLAVFEEGMRLLSKSGVVDGFLSVPGHEPLSPVRRGVRGDTNEECVFGADGRVQITTTTSSPYNMIGRIATGCSGTLIGNKYVLTAGHCVSNGSGTWYSSLNFTVAKDGSYEPWGSESWSNVLTTTAWHNSGDSNKDYALIVLSAAPHGGWAGWGTYSSGTHSVCGYPGDKPFGTMWNMGGSTSSNTYKIYYSFDTAGGQSGSGIRDTSNYVRGIHAYCYSSNNGGTRLTSTVYNTLQGWIADNP